MSSELYSDRLRKLKPPRDVWEYDKFEGPLRVKLQFAVFDLLTPKAGTVYADDVMEKRYRRIIDELRRKYGLARLSKGRNFQTELEQFMAEELDVERILDLVEFAYLVGFVYAHHQRREDITPGDVERFVSTVNEAFRQHGVGYEIEGRGVVRKDNEFMHIEVTKPALMLLSDAKWRGAEEEFERAHDHYRHRRNKEAMNEAAKSLESVMKAICERRGWVVSANATSKPLIDACFDNGLIPAFWQNQLGALRATLEGGVPTGRNKRSGHGQGATPVAVPDHMAGYMLHMAAAAIVFLVKADEALA